MACGRLTRRPSTTDAEGSDTTRGTVHLIAPAASSAQGLTIRLLLRVMIRPHGDPREHDSDPRTQVGAERPYAPLGSLVLNASVVSRFRHTLTRVRTEWRERGTAYEIARVLSSPARRLFVRVRVEGIENLPATGPVIVAANHLSFFDSILLMFDLPRQVRMLGKAEYTDRRLTRWLFVGAGMIPVRRTNPGDTTHALAQVRAVLDEGHAIGVFPEGTRSRDGLLHRGHCGAAHLAILTGAPLIPIGLVGTDQILPTGARLVRPFRTATVRIGAPIRPDELGVTRSTNRARRVITDELMSAVRLLSQQDYVDSFAPIGPRVALSPT